SLRVGEQVGVTLGPDDVLVPEEAPHPGGIAVDGLVGPHPGQLRPRVAGIEGPVEQAHAVAGHDSPSMSASAVRVPAVKPPSATSACPVTNDDSSEARNSAAAAIP